MSRYNRMDNVLLLLLILLRFGYCIDSCTGYRAISVGTGDEEMVLNKFRTNSILTNNCYAYSTPGDNTHTNQEDWKNVFCLPSIIVAGFPKCGSSFLFKSLSLHPSIIPTKRKELCLGGILSETWPKMIRFLPNSTQAHNKLVLSGCLHLGANIRAMKQLCARNIKLIYAVRDVADMLWAAYNFWCIEGVDDHCSPGKHASTGDIRSPEHFHSRVMAGLSMGGGIALGENGLCYKNELLRALQVYGEKNVKVIKSEDLLHPESKYRALQDISVFIELMDSSHDLETTNWLTSQRNKLYKVNSGISLRSRGEKQVTSLHAHVGPSESVGEVTGGVYEISGYRKMKDETRKFIYRKWKDECEWLRRQFGITYDSCL